MRSEFYADLNFFITKVLNKFHYKIIFYGGGEKKLGKDIPSTKLA